MYFFFSFCLVPIAMDTLIGVLLDVSGSMQRNNEEGTEIEAVPWARSIFDVIDNFVKYDVSSQNHIFSVAVGAKYGHGIFDVLKTIEELPNKSTEQIMDDAPSYADLVEEFYLLVENKNAKSTRAWATKDVIMNAVPYEKAYNLLSKLKADEDFLEKFVDKCLPRACKNVLGNHAVGNFVNGLQYFASSLGSQTGIRATQRQIEGIVNFAQSLFYLEDVGSVFSVRRASEILHGCIDVDNLNNERKQKLMETVNPFIYGGTPMYKALCKTADIFKEYSSHKKLLFVLSDGEPTDRVLPSVIETLKNSDITVVCCLIAQNSKVQPQMLYSVENSTWSPEAKFLFNLSSTISSQSLPRTVFIKKDWKIDISNNETKLFLQINHPDNILDACNLAKDVVCSQDSLSDLLAYVSLDTYINHSIDDFKARLQEGGTCYANASAAVLHLAMKRIRGRVRDPPSAWDYPEFEYLRDEIIKDYGVDGANTQAVLEKFTEKYRLHVKSLTSPQDALKAVVCKRPVIATFRLTDPEWTQFEKFFDNNKGGILTCAEIDLSKRDRSLKTDGHAVVLTSFNSKCLRFMNSWGETWADQGFFRVENIDVLGFKFFDVYWTLKDLKREEIAYFEKNGAQVAKQIIDKLQSLKRARYKCEKCSKSLLVTSYTGSLNATVCSSCGYTFKSSAAGNICALNLYLTSLAK